MAAPVAEGLPVPSGQQWTQELTRLEDAMPCPFCGVPPYHVRHKHPSWSHKHQVVCMNSDCSTVCATEQQQSLPKALEIWMRRPNIQEISVEEMMEELDKSDCFNA